jgi:uncharacterized cofD-like protein
MKEKQGQARVVLLGGGNGTSRLLRTLVPLLEGGEIYSLHALVLNADDGGSTGRLREQYEVSAMGDSTRCLVALSGFHDDDRGEQFLQALDYRYESGDFAGHTLRNIFLTSLERTSDLDSAIAMMARILQVPKRSGVVPLTLQPLTQQVVINFGGEQNLLGEGQHLISHQVNLQADPRWQPGDVRVQFAEREISLNPRARTVLQEATHIIVAPGHTFGTILPALASPGLGELVATSSAQLVVVMTLLTTPRQTTGWSGEDFIRVYESYLGRAVDTVIANTGSAPVPLVPGQEWVRFAGEGEAWQLLSGDLVDSELPRNAAGDVVPRAIVVHDVEKLTRLLRDALQSI